MPQASDVSKAAWLSAKKEMWRKERRHTEIMAGVGKQTKQAAQCRRDTLSHPSSRSGSTSSSGVPSSESHREEGDDRKETPATQSLPRSSFWMLSLEKQQQNNPWSSECQGTVKHSSSAGTKNGLNIYTGDEKRT